MNSLEKAQLGWMKGFKRMVHVKPKWFYVLSFVGTMLGYVLFSWWLAYEAVRKGYADDVEAEKLKKRLLESGKND